MPTHHTPSHAIEHPESPRCPRCSLDLGVIATQSVIDSSQDPALRVGHELDLPQPGETVTETYEIVPQEIVDRLREKAREFSSGEDNSYMQGIIEQSAFEYRLEKLTWGREAAAAIRRRQDHPPEEPDVDRADRDPGHP
jgi:hypothetical protein